MLSLNKIVSELKEFSPIYGLLSSLLLLIFLVSQNKIIDLETMFWWLVIIGPFWLIINRFISRSHGLIENVSLIWGLIPFLILFALASSNWDWLWRIGVLLFTIILSILSNYFKFPKLHITSWSSLLVLILPLLPLLFQAGFPENLLTIYLTIFTSFVLIKLVYDEVNKVTYKIKVFEINRIRFAWLLSIFSAVMFFINGLIIAGIFSLIPFIFAYLIKKIKLSHNIINWLLYFYLVILLVIIITSIVLAQQELLHWHFLGYLISTVTIVGIIAFIGNWDYIKRNYID